MKDIAILLTDLTKKYDHVSLPTLGAFIKKNNIITFDENEKWNDGKLENHYSKTYNVPLLNAQEDIEILVEQITKTLQQSKRYLFANFGFLYVNSQNKLEFSNQLSNLNVPNPSPSQSYTMLHSNQSNDHLKAKRNFKIWVSVIVVLAAACITIASLMFVTKVGKYFQTTPSPDSLQVTEVGVTEIKSDDTVTTQHNSASTEIQPDVLNLQRYHVVVSSESSKEKAIEKLKEFAALGYQPDIVEHHGKFRIFIGRYSDFRTAEKERKKILDKIPDAWLFKL